MYELALGVGAVPHLAAEVSSVSQTLGALGVVWVGLMAVLSLVIVTRADRRSEPDFPRHVDCRDAPIRHAA
jgi:hypothetical protein